MLSSRCLRNAMLAGLVLVLALALPVPAGASSEPVPANSPQDDARVSGTVTDAEGNPLEGVKIVISMLHQDPGFVPTEPVETTTDDEGSYFARDVKIAWVRITAALDGHGLTVVEVNLRRGRNRIDIEMEPAVMSEDVLRATEASDAYAMGVAAFEAGNHEDSIRFMEQARTNIDDNETNNDALAAISQNLGTSYLALGRLEEAKAQFDEWLMRMPDSADARLALAQVYREMGDDDAAAAQVEAAKTTGPQDPESHYNMGVMMIEAGDVEGGIAELEAAVQLRPDFPRAHKNLGYAYARTNEYQKAVDHFELFLEQEPDSPEVADVQQFIDALKSMIG
jgi:lipoprotein NlpI